MAQKLGVLVVDDSAFMRKIISQVIDSTGEFYTAAVARDGNEALELLAEKGAAIQLVTLDIQMPGMDGLTCLERIMALHPRRVVMISSLTTEGAAETLKSLELGAVDFVAKPGGAISLEFEQVAAQLVHTLKAAASARLPRPHAASDSAAIRQPAHPEPAAPRAPAAGGAAARKLVAIACSTGGPQALAALIPALPADLGAAVVVVQHMPAAFTGPLAARLDRASGLTVKEAREGDRLQEGLCLIAPGAYHLEFSPDEAVRLSKEPPVGGLRPCADVTFGALPPAFGRRIVGVVLTGMGHDGTGGCRALKSRGATVLAESQETALIYGMPKSVADAGLADRQVPLERMARAVVDALDAL